ncbi:3-oxoacyl-[acyl-carrier-protein] synthase III C-terminal domain-containing protein [Micromonospora sp. WMMD1102]|uniref:3-oxoacyl-[acyl-carrier-protein] synthase III C-terminal domain-containing protein n=1 Tax=Micromonospora sp. WMMD1102 TaxID=3016105 RepID=UPI0024153502|nr:3-oxoacyl-[acyl-carrier-protein] synthase III C-terminal domain-containing protein [Micromonospora sp. WMMD1102]MDG4785111.1 3-oxoacyl-[acyl-carrier-protein] synthase III C-terminal domain-containing protein [Micromonospora sp. WMMD1102]
MTVTLSRVATRLPSRLDPVDEILERSGRPRTERRLMTRVYGMRSSPTLDTGERLLDLLVDAGRAALRGRPAGMVLYGHTLLVQPFGQDGTFAAALRTGLGLPGADVYGVSGIACTSVLRSIELAARYLDRPGVDADETVLVLGGDQGSLGGASRVIPGFVVCGDGAAALTVRRGRGRYRYLAGAAVRDTRFHHNLRMSDEDAREFGTSSVHGVVRAIREALAGGGLELSDVDWVLPARCNRFVWQAICRELGLGIDRVHLDLLADQGHVFGLDALLSLAHLDGAGRLRPGARCVLVAIGQGAYFQASVVEVIREEGTADG